MFCNSLTTSTWMASYFSRGLWVPTDGVTHVPPLLASPQIPIIVLYLHRHFKVGALDYIMPAPPAGAYPHFIVVLYSSLTTRLGSAIPSKLSLHLPHRCITRRGTGNSDKPKTAVYSPILGPVSRHCRTFDEYPLQAHQRSPENDMCNPQVK